MKFAKKIEDDFQRLADLIIQGQFSNFNEERKYVVSSFYALWVARAQIREKPEKDRYAGHLAGSCMVKA